MKKVAEIDTRTLREKLVAVLFYSTRYGASRRAELVPLLKEWQKEWTEGLRVNARHCAIFEKDPDLQYLVSHNKAKLVRIQTSKKTRYTYLQLVGE